MSHSVIQKKLCIHKIKAPFRMIGALVLVILLFWGGLFSCANTDTVDSIEYTELGIPSSSRYSKGIRARCPWDMIVWDEKLYVGSGDYDSNEGPVDMWCYDIEQSVWKNTGTVPDEEISRFCIVGNALVAPGIDPKEDWTYGNYYRFEGEKWIKIRSIPGGLHNFDMVEYDGKIFCGLGVESGQSPLACSSDNGKTFVPVQMLRGGVALDTSDSQHVRVYDLFVLNNNLYATFMYGDREITYDLYRYENGVFVYDNQWYQKIHQVKFTNNIISGKTEFNGHMFFTTGYLYATDDMANFTRISFPNSEVVYDISISDNVIYALCGVQKEDGTYNVSVWKNEDGDITAFSEVFNFTYEIPPLSIACYDGDFYIGMGNTMSNHDKNGMILHIDYEK